MIPEFWRNGKVMDDIKKNHITQSFLVQFPHSTGAYLRRLLGFKRWIVQGTSRGNLGNEPVRSSWIFLHFIF